MFNIFKGKSELNMTAPCDGKVVLIEDVPDPLFAEKMVGDGFAIIPSSTDILSPVDGKIIQVFPTHHAVCIESVDGLEIIVHVGIDTVELKGEGFACYTEVGATVKSGDKLLSFTPEVLEAHGKNSITPVVITNKEIIKTLKVRTGTIAAGKTATTLTLV